MFYSIRWRLVLSYVLMSVLIVALVGLLALTLVKRNVIERQERQLQANAEAVAKQATPLVQSLVRQTELQELARTSAFLGNARVRILDSRHQLLADSGSGEGGDEYVWVLPPVEWQIEAGGNLFSPWVVALPLGRDVRLSGLQDESFFSIEQLSADAAFTLVRQWEGLWGNHFVFEMMPELDQALPTPEADVATPRSDSAITVPIEGEGSVLGYVEISGGPDYSSEALTTARRAFLLAAGWAMVVAVIVGLVVSRSLSAPLRELAGVAAQMSGGQLSMRARVRGKDEIGQLAGQFNQMAGRLEASFAALQAERDALRRFIADASHELRTPITALRNFNDLLQGAAAEDIESRAEFMAESKVQLERMEWIVGNLLDLSRLEAGLTALQLDTHDAAAIVESVVSALRSAARERELSLCFQSPENIVRVHCDRTRIELALSNLLDNALRYTPPGGEVHAGIEESDRGVDFWVRDNGPGIEAEELAYVFERFFRGRGIRSPGSGLGLAIVKSIAEAHGGSASVVSEPGAGSLFSITLPNS